MRSSWTDTSVRSCLVEAEGALFARVCSAALVNVDTSRERVASESLLAKTLRRVAGRALRVEAA